MLRGESWARERLRPFAGEAVALRAPPLPELRLRIEPDGTVAPGGGTPSLEVRVTPAILAGLARGEEHALRAVEVAGNERLASEVMFLVRHLRWDFEEDLARVFGDVAAHRLADYATEEDALLVRRGELAALAADLARLRDALERLDKRIARLG